MDDNPLLDGLDPGPLRPRKKNGRRPKKRVLIPGELRPPRVAKVKPMPELEPNIAPEAATPPPPFSDTPEFKEAVMKAASSALAEMMKTAGAEKESASDARSLMQALAMEISQLTDQGTGRARVAPEILRNRQAGLERMMKLLVEARKEGKIVTWRVKNKCHLADRVVEPFWIAADHTAQPTIIDWDGPPNESLAPENKAAEEIMDAFRQWIGSSARVIPEDRLAITPGGLVVHGGAASISAGKRKVDPEAPQTGKPVENEGALNIHHKNVPGRYIEKNILGTIQEPARQTV